MGFRLVSFLFLAGCVWVAVEVYTEGTDGAFGGILARVRPAASSPASTSTPLERIQRSASGSRDRQLERIEGQLEGESVGLRSARERQLDD